MKKATLFIIFDILTIFVSAQVTDDISEVPSLNKGKIILTNGNSFEFNQLNVSKDIVIIKNHHSEISKFPSEDIYKISKTGNWALEGAVLSGAGWLLGAALGTSDWDNNLYLKDSKDFYIYGGALISAAIGGLGGAFIKKDKTVYKNNKNLEFTPLVFRNPEGKTTLQLTCKIYMNLN